MSPNNPYANEPALDNLDTNGLSEDAEVIRDLADRLVAERATRPSGPKLTALGLSLTLVVIGCLATASLLPIVKFPGDAGNYLGHLSAYGLAMGSLVVLARLRPWVAALMLFVIGVVIEFVQPYVGRATHVEDVLANTAGIIIVWCCVALWRRVWIRKRLTSTRVDW